MFNYSYFFQIFKASLVAMMAGSDFIKTSTGKEAINATLPVGVVMARAIRDYHEKMGYKVKLSYLVINVRILFIIFESICPHANLT